MKEFINQMMNKFLSKKKASVIEEMDNASNAYFYTAGQPVWTERNYDSFTSAFMENPIVHGIIRHIVNSAKSIPTVLRKKIGKKSIVLKSHPILDMLCSSRLTNSNISILEQIYSYRQITGNAYVLAIPDEKSGKQIGKFEVLRPDRVQVIAGYNNTAIGYRYSINNKYVDYMIDFDTGYSPILHIKNFNPISDWYGLSPIEAALFSIEQHNHSSALNQTLLQNGGRPSGVILVKEKEGRNQNMTQEQFARLKNNIDDIMSNAKNAGRPLILEGGLEWKEMSMSPRDMKYIDSKKILAKEIAFALGYPAYLLGIHGDATYNNFNEARISFWEQTIIPLVSDTINALSKWITGIYNNNNSDNENFDEYDEEESFELDYDTKGIGVVAKGEEDLWDRIEKSSIMTINEKRKVLNLDPIEGGDVIGNSAINLDLTKKNSVKSEGTENDIKK